MTLYFIDMYINGNLTLNSN